MPHNLPEVDAINYILENVFDWQGPGKNPCMRLSYDDGKLIVKSLRKNLEVTCPNVNQPRIFEYLDDLLQNNWIGDLADIEVMTRRIIIAYLDAGQGNPAILDGMLAEMGGRIRFKERHYSDVGHSHEVPLKALADAMDRNESIQSRQSAESLSGSLNKVRQIVDNGGDGKANRIAKQLFPGLVKLAGR